MGGSCSQVPSWHTNAPRETYAWTGTSAARTQSPCRHLHVHTRTQRDHARVTGAQKCIQSFRAAGTHVHTHSPGVSHTESRTNTLAPGCTVAPQLWFLQEQGEREGGPEGRDLVVTPPPHLTGTRSSLSEEVAGRGRGGGSGGEGRHPASLPLSLSSPRLGGLPFPTCLP